MTNDNVEAVRRLAARGEVDAAREALATLCADAVSLDRLEVGRCAIELALPSLALKQLNLALRDDPGQPAVLAELALLYEDRGDAKQEMRCRRQLAALQSEPENDRRLEELTRTEDAPVASPQPAPAVQDLAPATDADITRFLHMFSGREGVHARMWFDRRRGTGYAPVEQPITPSLLRAHLGGSMTLGVYPVRLDDTVNFFAFDIDVTKRAIDRARGDRDETRRLRRLLRETATRMRDDLVARGFDPVHIDSGYKGRHLWVFLREPLPAELVRKLALALGRASWKTQRDVSLEVFPKQGEVSRDKLGNLIKLPLGIHLRSKRRSWILGPDGQRVADPWALLRGVGTLTRTDVLDRLALLRDDAQHEEVDFQAVEEDQTHTLPSPPALPDRPAFTEADFDLQPVVAAMKRRCPVLGALIDKGLEHRRLTHDEQVIMRHTLGHVPEALPAVNYVFERCPEVGPAMMLQSPLRGSPMSCPKIRKRIPNVTSGVACHCKFTVSPDHYPTPILHVEEARARGELVEPQAEEDPGERVAEDIARTYLHLDEKVRRLEEELREVRTRFVDALERLPGRKLVTSEGVWRVEDEDGFPVIRWADGEAGRDEEE